MFFLRLDVIVSCNVPLPLGFTNELHHSLSGYVGKKWPDQEKAEYRDSLKNGSAS
jgi:hypothetical protein